MKSKVPFIFFSFVLPLLLGNLCQAQQYKISSRSIGVEDGLSSRTVTHFFFDSRGLTWMSTPNGLNRYDGYQVKTYSVENGSLKNNAVGSMAEDFEGNIWVLGRNPNKGNQLQVQIFNPLNQRAIDFDFFTKAPFRSNEAKIIKSDPKTRTVWIITTSDSVYRYAPNAAGRGQFELRHTSETRLFNGRACPQGFWVQSPTELKLIDHDGRVIKSFEMEAKVALRLLDADAVGDLYHLGNLPGTAAYGFRLILLKNESPLNGADLSFWEGKRPVGFDPYQKLAWYSGKGERITIYDSLNRPVHSTNEKQAFFSFPKYLEFDQFGNGWSNHNGRVYITRLEKLKFTNYLTDVSVFGLDGYGARGLYVNDQNELYTNGLGLSMKIDLNTGKEEPFRSTPEFYSGRADQENLKRLAMLADKQGNIWFTDEATRLTRYDVKKHTFHNYSFAKDGKRVEKDPRSSYRNLLHWSAFFDSRGRLWLGGRFGLKYLHPSDSVITPFERYGGFITLEGSDIFHFYEDEKGIWIASETGLYLLNKHYELIQHFHKEGAEGQKIPENNIAHVRGDEDGQLWLATRGGGLIHLNPETGEYSQFTKNDGLSDNVTYATYMDEYGFMWVPSNKGIMRIAIDDFEVSTYLTADGLPHEEFNTTSHFQAKDGRLFFGGLDGVTGFNPRDFLVSPDQSITPVILDVEKQSKKTGIYTDYSQEFHSTGKIVIKPGELGLNLGFTLLDYINAPSNLFYYKIDGIDQDWNFLDRPQVRLNSLPYGKYNLRIRGQSSRGRWSAEASVPIYVLRPFYLRWWFFVSLGILIAISLWVFIRKRERTLLQRQAYLEEQVNERTAKISQQAQELKELDKLKSKFFANVSHELRTPLSLIKAPLDILIKQKELPEPAQKELGRIQRNSDKMGEMVEELLDLARLENGRIEPHYEAIDIESYFARLFNNFESKAEVQRIQYQYQYKGPAQANFHLDMNMVEKIINNLLSNALKFTPKAGSIQMDVQLIESELEVTVTDSGIGISKQDLPYVFDRFFQTKDPTKAATGGTGIGLALSHELADAMNAQLTVSSTEGSGSSFKLVLADQPKLVIPTPNPAETHTISTVSGLPDVIEGEPQSFSVLVIEDHADMRSFISDYLSTDHHVIQAENGVEALRQLQAGSKLPDVIITDMMMPEMDGLEFLAHARGTAHLQDIPVLMLTARTAERDKLEAFRLGVDDYLSKPFSVEELRARLKNLLKVSASRKLANATTATDDTEETLVTKTDQWLLKVKEIVEENVHKFDFNIRSVAESLNLSERQFQRNLKKATGYTPTIYLKEIRLQMARVYLEERRFEQVSEVSTAVGFTTTPYFSKMFKERFGKLPSSYFLEA